MFKGSWPCIQNSTGSGHYIVYQGVAVQSYFNHVCMPKLSYFNLQKEVFPCCNNVQTPKESK